VLNAFRPVYPPYTGRPDVKLREEPVGEGQQYRTYLLKNLELIEGSKRIPGFPLPTISASQLTHSLILDSNNRSG
jgi:hypothetical protein